MGVNYKALLESYQHNEAQAEQWLGEAFQKKEVRVVDFDFGKLFAECFGWQAFVECRNDRTRLVNTIMEERFQEGAAGAVSTHAFQTISQQIVYNATIEAYDAPEFVFSKLIPSQPSQFRTERIPGISGIGDESRVVAEGDPFPQVGVSESWVDSPVTQKRGFAIGLTREAVFFDRTGLLIERCNKAAYWQAYNQELRAIDCVIDENAAAVNAMMGGHRYHWKNNSIASYGNNSGTHNWDNLQASNTLLDYSDLENAELLFDVLTDPDTGVVTGAYRGAVTDLIITTQLLHTAKQILDATEIRVAITGYPTSGNPAMRVSPNSLEPGYRIVTSPLLSTRLGTDTTWFLGNVARYAVYMENWPIETIQAPANSHDEFHRDIVMQWRVSECGAYRVKDPRFIVQSTVA